MISDCETFTMLVPLKLNIIKLSIPSVLLFLLFLVLFRSTCNRWSLMTPAQPSQTTIGSTHAIACLWDGAMNGQWIPAVSRMCRLRAMAPSSRRPSPSYQAFWSLVFGWFLGTRAKDRAGLAKNSKPPTPQNLSMYNIVQW